MGDVANALKLKAADTMLTGAQKVGEKAADTARTITDAAAEVVAKGKAKRKTAKPPAPATGVVDPLQWWGALTQQFQEIAAGAMKDAATQTAVSTAKNMATGVAKEAMKTATGMARKAATKRPAKKAAR
jgi:hypothetical protein